MRISQTILIEKPIEEVWAAFDDPTRMKAWQPTLKSFEHLSGEPGQPGAESKLVYVEGKRTIEMVETILERGKYHLSGTYIVGGSVSQTTNQVDNVFERANGHTTWRMVSEFRFSGMERFIMPLMRPMFAKRTRQDMQRFKEMVESA